MAGCPLLSGANGESPWAATAGDAAGVLSDWEASVDVDWEAAAGRMLAYPDVWPDGSLVGDEVSGASFAGSGVYARLHVDTWRRRRWRHFEDLGPTSDGLAVSCLGLFRLFRGPSIGFSSLFCRLLTLSIWVLIISMLLEMLGGCSVVFLPTAFGAGG